MLDILMRFFLIPFLVNITIGFAIAQKPRLIITTDIGQDPDDEQSMVRLLHYSDEFDLEGIIVNADVNYEKEEPVLKPHIVHEMIESYAKIEAYLRLHSGHFPKSSYLHTIVKEGTFGNGVNVPIEKYIGKGKDTQGSDWIIDVVDRDDPRQVNISIWGGACDLTQALWKIKNTRNSQEADAFVKKLRVFFIGKQDSSNQWIIDNFPDMWLVLALDKGGDKWESGYRGMFWGGDMSNTSKAWLHEHIIGQNPLADHYPDQAYTGGENKNPYMAMKEGDSPSFLFFLENGINDPGHPEYGSWGGRYQLERDNFYRDANDTFFDEQTQKLILSPRSTVFRWRQDFQNDFSARVQWGKSSYEEANHHPELIINGIKNKGALDIEANSGETILLDAGKSSDPDNDQLKFEWYIYKEAGTFKGDLEIKYEKNDKVSLFLPQTATGQSIHLICSVKDDVIPALMAYKRVIVHVR